MDKNIKKILFSEVLLKITSLQAIEEWCPNALSCLSNVFNSLKELQPFFPENRCWWSIGLPECCLVPMFGGNAFTFGGLSLFSGNVGGSDYVW